MRAVVLAALFAGVASFTTPARAEDLCPPGQVAAADGTCVAAPAPTAAPAPQCPAGYRFDGLSCVVGSAPVAPSPVMSPTPSSDTPQPAVSEPAPPAAYTGPTEWPTANGPPTDAFNPTPGREIRRPYFWTAVAFFLAAYGPKIVTVLSSRDRDAGCYDVTDGLILVPVLGGILGLISSASCHGTEVYSSYTYEYGYFSDAPIGPVDSFAVDLLGIAWLTIALIGRPAADWQTRAGTVRFVPSVAGGSGATLALDF